MPRNPVFCIATLLTLMAAWPLQAQQQTQAPLPTEPKQATPPAQAEPLPPAPPPTEAPPQQERPPATEVPPTTDATPAPTDAQVPVQDERLLPERADLPPSPPAEPLPPPTGPAMPDLRNDRTGFVGLLRAQVLLDRSWMSPGEVDGRNGTNTVRAIGGFQRVAGLPVTGVLDDATWSALEARGPALVRYTLTAADVKGPFRPMPGSMYGKAKLPALSYGSVGEALGEKFHVRPEALQQLNPGKDLGVAGTEIIVPNVRDITRLPQATRIVVSEAAKLLMLINPEGKVYAQFPVTTGSVRDPLPIGEWELRSVAKDPHYNYNPKLFKGAKPGPLATLPPGPNSPVGVMWMGLSKPHYGIHGTPEPGNISKTQSNGCIRMTNWSVLQVSNAVSRGTPVTLIP